MNSCTYLLKYNTNIESLPEKIYNFNVQIIQILNKTPLKTCQ